MSLRQSCPPRRAPRTTPQTCQGRENFLSPPADITGVVVSLVSYLRSKVLAAEGEPPVQGPKDQVAASPTQTGGRPPCLSTLLRKPVLILLPKQPSWLLEIMEKKIINSCRSSGGANSQCCLWCRFLAGGQKSDIDSKVNLNI